MENLEKDRTYLIRYGTTTTLNLITVLTITDTSYQIRWNNNINNPITWEMKGSFHANYTLIEDISNVNYDKSIQYNISTTPIEFPVYKFPTYKYIKCPKCDGKGVVINTNSTSGAELCPRCLGNGMILDSIET